MPCVLRPGRCSRDKLASKSREACILDVTYLGMLKRQENCPSISSKCVPDHERITRRGAELSELQLRGVLHTTSKPRMSFAVAEVAQVDVVQVAGGTLVPSHSRAEWPILNSAHRHVLCIPTSRLRHHQANELVDKNNKQLAPCVCIKAKGMGEGSSILTAAVA